MRHFAQDLNARGFKVRYVKLNDPHNTGSIEGELQRALVEMSPQELVATAPREYRLMQIMNSWSKKFNLPVTIRSDDRFLCSIDNFHQWTQGKKTLHMEFFYREMRKRYQILLEAE